MWSFILATVWSVLCSTLGGLCASALARACPDCSPVLHCPALTCRCGSGVETLLAGPATPCTAAPGCSLQLVAAAYAAGLVTAAVVVVSVKLWVRGAWVAEGGLALGQPLAGGAVPLAAAAAISGVLSPTPRRALPAPAASATRSDKPAAAVVPPPAPTAALVHGNDDVAVWRPRRS